MKLRKFLKVLNPFEQVAIDNGTILPRDTVYNLMRELSMSQLAQKVVRVRLEWSKNLAFYVIVLESAL